jgi:putative transposase
MKACQGFFKGLAGRPAFKKKHGRQTVWITSELFEITGGVLTLGTKSHPVGQLKFTAHLPYDPPASITISRDAGKWYVSFTQEIEGVEASEADLIDRFKSMTPGELETITVGLDRGVVIPVKTSGNHDYGFSEVLTDRLKKTDRRRKRRQRKKARQQKGSKRQRQTGDRIARCYDYTGNVRRDVAHKASHHLVARL